jgi:predicted O-methyltransferase YrrM
VDPRLAKAAEEAIGFMPRNEGQALHRAALAAARSGPLLEVGSYCGKSAIYLGAAAREGGSVLFTIDHHRGSEENQPGQEHHDPRLVDSAGRLDTLPHLRAAIARAELEDVVVAIVGPSATVARHWRTQLAMVFIDGGHSQAAVNADFEGWAPHLMPGGVLAIHDVFPDPTEGGRPPFEVYERALASGGFVEIDAVGSLRVLRRR